MKYKTGFYLLLVFIGITYIVQGFNRVVDNAVEKGRVIERQQRTEKYNRLATAQAADAQMKRESYKKMTATEKLISKWRNRK